MPNTIKEVCRLSFNLSANSLTPIAGKTQIILTVTPNPTTAWAITMFSGGTPLYSYTVPAGTNSFNFGTFGGPIGAVFTFQANVAGALSNIISVTLSLTPPPPTSNNKLLAVGIIGSAILLTGVVAYKYRKKRY